MIIKNDYDFMLFSKKSIAKNALKNTLKIFATLFSKKRMCNPTDYIISLLNVKDYDENKLNNYIDKYETKIDWKKLYDHFKNSKTSLGLYLIGNMYHFGKYMGQNYEKAKELYERAIELNNSEAMNNLGYMYHFEQGVKQDYEKAKELYEKAMELNNSKAINNLGYMYNHGEGVEQNSEKAKELYERLIELNDSDAMNYLAYMYDLGEGVEQNSEKAKELYEKSIKLKNSSAMNNLAYMYYYGLGIEKNIKKAVKLYKQSIKTELSENNIKNLIELLIYEKIYDEYAIKLCENNYDNKKSKEYLKIMYNNEKYIEFNRKRQQKSDCFKSIIKFYFIQKGLQVMYKYIDIYI